MIEPHTPLLLSSHDAIAKRAVAILLAAMSVVTIFTGEQALTVTAFAAEKDKNQSAVNTEMIVDDSYENDEVPVWADADNLVQKQLEAMKAMEEYGYNKVTAGERTTANHPDAPDNAIVGKSFEIPSAGKSFKAWMGYKAITAKRSLQYKLQQNATTDEYGFRRYNGYYMIALGTYYTGYSCGKYFRITLDTGVTFDAITGDVKSDAHTDAKHQHRNGNIVEFIVDTSKIESVCKRSGDMSDANGGMFSGKVVKIEELL